MIIQLESPNEEIASDHLSHLMIEAIENPNEHLIAFLRGLWDDEPWNDIVEKFSTEGSVWYVWWMDGVRFFLSEEKKDKQRYVG